MANIVMKTYDALDLAERGEFYESVEKENIVTFNLMKTTLRPFQHTFKSISNLRNVLDRWISKQ